MMTCRLPIRSQAEARSRLSRALREEQTAHRQPTTGTPVEVPEPSNVREIGGFFGGMSGIGLPSMRALVTGASGFIGSTLVEELNRQGIEACALMRRTSSPAHLEGLRYCRVEGDLADEASLRAAVEGMDYVFHLAGVVAGPSRDYYLEHNARGTARLARAAADAQRSGAARIRRFVLVSSLAAGGPAKSREPRRETHPDEPVSAYGVSKLEGERELLKYRDIFPVSIIRPPMVYGPRDKGVYVVIRAVARGLAPVMPTRDPAGQKLYSAIHASDLCRGVIQAAVTEQVPSGEVFYLAGDGVHAFQDLVDAMAAPLGRRPLRLPLPRLALTGAAAGLTLLGALTRKTFPLNLDKLNEILPDYWICSSDKARSAFGFKPEVDLQRGMTETVQWYRSKGWL
jgi:dihydroflavonol-4-reductase